MFNEINKINNLTNYYKNSTGNNRRGYDRIKNSLDPKNIYRKRGTLSDFNLSNPQNNFFSSKREISLNTNESSKSSNRSIFGSFKHSNFQLTDNSKYSNNSNSKNNSTTFQKSDSNTKIFQNNNLKTKLNQISNENIFKNPKHNLTRKSLKITLPYNYKKY